MIPDNSNDPPGGQRSPSLVGRVFFGGLVLAMHVALAGYQGGSPRSGFRSEPPTFLDAHLAEVIYGPSPEDRALKSWNERISAERPEPLWIDPVSESRADARKPVEDPQSAARLAAWRANSEYWKEWGRAPSAPATYPASLWDDRWYWEGYQDRNWFERVRRSDKWPACP